MKNPKKPKVIEQILMTEIKLEAENIEDQLESEEIPVSRPFQWEGRFLMSADLRKELSDWIHSHHP